MTQTQRLTTNPHDLSRHPHHQQLRKIKKWLIRIPALETKVRIQHRQPKYRSE